MQQQQQQQKTLISNTEAAYMQPWRQAMDRERKLPKDFKSVWESKGKALC